MSRPEQIFHQQAATFLHAVLPPEVIWTTIGHGGGGKTRGAILKSMGVLSGVLDIAIFYIRPNFLLPHTRQLDITETCWLELKSSRGRLSPDQVSFSQRVSALGHYCFLCRTIEDISIALTKANVPTRPYRFNALGAAVIG